MKVSVGILTFNVYRTGRRELLDATVQSIRAGKPHSIDLLTNGSVDATDKAVAQYAVLPDVTGHIDNRNPAAWYGMQRCIEIALSHEPDIVVLSADDITYHEGWHDRLTTFWQHAPEDVKLVSLFIEPEWTAWNAVTERIDVAGIPALVRNSTPSASWSFRASDAGLILPMPQQSPGEDHIVNQRLRAEGYRLAQIDLAEHSGQESSAWGNRSHLRPDMIPVETVKATWGLA